MSAQTFSISKTLSPLWSAQESPNSLGARIRDAKAKGRKRVLLTNDGIIPEYEEVEDLKTALSRYLVILARPIQKTTVLTSQSNILTYYRFEILETLSDEQPKWLFLGKRPLPNEVESPNKNEIYIVRTGGAVVIDDIEVILPDRDGMFTMSQKYLLFVTTNESKTIGNIRIGPIGIYRVNDEEALRPLDLFDHPLARTLARDYANSLKKLREDLQNLPKN